MGTYLILHHSLYRVPVNLNFKMAKLLHVTLYSVPGTFFGQYIVILIMFYLTSIYTTVLLISSLLAIEKADSTSAYFVKLDQILHYSCLGFCQFLGSKLILTIIFIIVFQLSKSYSSPC